MKDLLLQVRYLTERCVATAYNDRELAEWPPHPARVYSALLSSWAASEEQDPAERAALEWLASLDAPSIYASEAGRRQVVPHFVPVNDVAVLDGFERSHARLLELQRALDEAKAEYETTERLGDDKAVAKAKKVLAKAEKAEGVERKKIKEAALADQRPFASGQHPGTALTSARALIPEQRGKQPRAFPSVSPDDSRVFFRWSAATDALTLHAAGLSALVRRVVRIGHSASLVACTVVDEGPASNWEPSDTGREVFRVPGPGQLFQLEQAFERHGESEPRVLPCRFQRYVRVGRLAAELKGASHFGQDWLVFRQVGGLRLSQTVIAEVARAMRGGLMTHGDDPPPELLSGHSPNGEPSTVSHLAIVPLPFVGSPHATGELLGLALIFPRDADTQARQAVLRAIGRWEDARRAELEDELIDTPPLSLTLGRAGVIKLERIEWGVAPLKTLRSTSWCRPSRAWATATPIALDRNPGDLYSRDREKAAAAHEAAEVTIATACERIGLPAPSYVQVHPSVPLHGAVKARAFPRYPADPNKHQRVKVHARIDFPVPVEGPVLLGAGRFYGLGLCLPLPHEGTVQS